MTNNKQAKHNYSALAEVLLATSVFITSGRTLAHHIAFAAISAWL